MNLFMNRATRARIHVGLLDAMPDNDSYQAYAEACAYAEFPGEVFELARAVDAFTAKELYRADVQYADVDATELRAAVDAETVNLALRLCGIRARSAHGRKVRWTDAPDHEPTMPVTLPVDLLETWNSE